MWVWLEEMGVACGCGLRRLVWLQTEEVHGVGVA